MLVKQGASRRRGAARCRGGAGAGEGPWRPALAAAGAGALSALALVPRAYGGVPGGDAGELLAEACLGGVAHPPGYALWVLSNGAWMRLVRAACPACSPAWAANVLSALCGAGASALVALAVTELSDPWPGGSGEDELDGALAGEQDPQLDPQLDPRRPRAEERPELEDEGVLRCACAVAGGSLFSLAPLVWSYTVTAEVFALNNLLCAALLWLTARLSRSAAPPGSPLLPEGPREAPARRPKSAPKKLLASLARSGTVIDNSSTASSTPAPATLAAPECAAAASPTERQAARAAAARLRLGCAGALVCGLGLSNQHTSVLFATPLIVYVLLVADRPARPARWLAYACAFLAGLLPNAHLVLAPPTRGSWGDTSTLSGALTHVLRREYGTLKLSPMQGASEGALERTLAYAADAALEQLAPARWLAPALWLAAALGLARLGGVLGPGWARGDGRAGGARAVLAAWAVYLLVFHALANLPLDKPMPREVHRRFWMQPHLVVCLAVGLGLEAMLSSAPHWPGRGTRLPAPGALLLGPGRPGPSAASKAAALLAALAAAAAARVRASARVADGAVSAYADALLGALPPGALVLSHTDINWNAVRYKQECEGVRPDVRHLSAQLLPYPWFAARQQQRFFPDLAFPPVFYRNVSTNRMSEANSQLILRFALANLERGAPVFLDLHSLNDLKLGPDNAYGFGLPAHLAQLHVVPEGLLWRVQRASPERLSADGLERWRIESQPALATVRDALRQLLAPEPELPPGSWERAAISILWDAVYQRALFLLSAGLARPATSFFLGAVHESATLLGLVVDTLRGAGDAATVSVAPADATRNAALAAAQWSNVVSKMANKTQRAAFTGPARELAAKCISAFLHEGDEADPAYAKFKTVYEALLAEDQQHQQHRQQPKTASSRP
jgi:hypothetical protein